MKRFIMALAAGAALLCGCDKYGDRIEKIEERVTKLEQLCDDLNANIAAVKKIVEAQASNITIKNVAKAENGFTIEFSDGTSYYIKNGEKGDKGDAPTITAVAGEDGVYYWKINGEWLIDASGNKLPVSGVTPQLKIEDGNWFVSYDNGKNWEKLGVAGSGTKVKFTEDDEYYYFDFGDGNIAKIAKMRAFSVKVEKDTVFVSAASPVKLGYSLIGDDKTVHVVAEANGYAVKVNESAKSIEITTDSNTEPGYVIVKAIRNSDGASTSQFITVNPEVKELQTISMEVEAISYNYIQISTKVSDQSMPYMVLAATDEDLTYYDNLDELYDEFIAYLKYIADSYEMTLDQVISYFCLKGDMTGLKLTDLEESTKYNIIGFGIGSDYSRGTEFAQSQATTTENTEGDPGYNAVLGTWNIQATQVNNDKTTTEKDLTITIEEYEKNKSFIVTGLYSTYTALADWDEESSVFSIPFGADNVIGKFNFGSIGVKYGCWMGYDGTYVYTKGSLYWGLNEDFSEMKSVSQDSSQQPLDPIGVLCGVYDINEDDSVGSWSKYTFGVTYLFNTIKKADTQTSAASSSTGRKELKYCQSFKHAMMNLDKKEEKAHKCMLEVR